MMKKIEKLDNKLNELAYKIERVATYLVIVSTWVMAVPYLVGGVFTLNIWKILGASAFLVTSWVLYRERRAEDKVEAQVRKWHEDQKKGTNK